MTRAIHLPTLKLTLPLTTGSAVVLLQRRLTFHGFKGEIDGRFGFATQSKVQKFQESRGLKPTGICDEECWKELLKE